MPPEECFKRRLVAMADVLFEQFTVRDGGVVVPENDPAHAVNDAVEWSRCVHVYLA
jgi:hypothetical protein